MNKYRNYAMILSTLGMALLLVGFTYSFFNYTKTGGANNLGTGNISFNATYGNAINLTNVFPMTSSEANEANLSSTTINITGSTNYNDGEEFLVSIVNVNNSVNGKKIPINYIATYEASGGSIGTSTDNYFEATKNANIYKLNSTGSVIEGKQVLVGFIKSSVSGTLTIKAYVDADRIAITDTPDENSDWIAGRTVFSTTEWNSFNSTPLSFKLRTESNQGTWVEEPEPDNVLDASCFTKRAVNVYNVNTNMTQTELGYCTSYINSLNLSFNTGATAQDFCLGNAQYNGYTFQATLDDIDYGMNYDIDYLTEHNIISVEKGMMLYGYDKSCGRDLVIPNKIDYALPYYNTNIDNQGISDCVDYLSNKGWTGNTNAGDTLENFCSGTGNLWGWSFQKNLDEGSFSDSDIEYLLNHNIIVTGPTQKYKVLVFSMDSVFFNDKISSVVFNKDLKIISKDNLYGADIEDVDSITIPSSVRYIGRMAFGPMSRSNGKQLTILGKPFIGTYAIADDFIVSYGGTCSELYKNSGAYYIFDNKSYILYGSWDSEHNVTTTDTNTCKVYSTTD